EALFNLFRKSKPSTGPFNFEQIGVDMHSHILPGIDDGARDIENSLTLIRGLSNLGFRKLIATPHVMWDMYRNTPATINEQLRIVKEAVAAEGINVELHAAAEYFLDEHVEDQLRNKKPLLTI